MTLATLIEGKALWQTVVASVVAGVGITFLFSLGIWGSGQFLEFRRGNQPALAVAAGVVGALALLGVAAAVIIGIVVMTSK
ncbi:MAG TPA: hypothetical protein VFJ61_12240 [Solirubrobacterales bacterium]|nr:hypothetical protein [Solirubrobacterales bacterium]